jgi:hypothetical protein
MNKFETTLKNTNVVNLTLQEYLTESLNSDDKYCKGWAYLKKNLTLKLLHILTLEEYWNITYNSQKADYIINYYGVNLNKEHKDQLESFVYVWNTIERENREQEKEENLKAELEKEGFKLIEFKNRELLKEYINKKVECVLDVNAIGILGSFDKTVRKEGKIIYSEYQNAYMFIPKRCRTRGSIVSSRCYVRGLK